MGGAEVIDREPAADPGARVSAAWRVLETVLDPEVPALSLVDLGIVREVQAQTKGLQVVLTPTYSGCPATEFIEQSVVDALGQAGLGPVQVLTRRAPAWTTDWITEQGRARLLAYGIAPPGPLPPGTEVPLRFMPRTHTAAPALACPRCGSLQTERLSAFGSTACKALYKCLDCQEPFDYFKPY